MPHMYHTPLCGVLIQIKLLAMLSDRISLHLLLLKASIYPQHMFLAVVTVVLVNRGNRRIWSDRLLRLPTTCCAYFPVSSYLCSFQNSLNYSSAQQFARSGMCWLYYSLRMCCTWKVLLALDSPTPQMGIHQPMMTRYINLGKLSLCWFPDLLFPDRHWQS